jgi:glycosyltransferase involved in cell wall biosynthesis
MSSISLAVMVRDDASRIQRCIESLRGSVDEVVVLDTGSIDDTVAVAKDAGARVVQTEWDGSFSSGLNKLMREVKTEWTLRLDSDEWFETSPATALRNAMKRDDQYGYRLVRRDILPNGGYREISIFRLWRTHPALRYEGIVHENISNDSIVEAFPSLKVAALPLWFWHDGYAEPTNTKLDRNIKLLEEELRVRPNQPYYRAMRAVMYRDLEDPRALAELEKVADEALEETTPSTRMYAGVFSAILEATPEQQIQDPRIGKVIARCWQWFHNYPGVLWAIGIAETRRRNPDQALRAYMSLRELAESGKYETAMPFEPQILGHSLWNALGFTANQIGRTDIAAYCARKLSSRA